MTEQEWEALRSNLLKQFDEDTVQQALLELLETQQKGVVVLDPLLWCCKCANRRRINELHRTIAEREGKAALDAFGITMPTMTRQDKDRQRKRRSRKKVA